MLKILKGALALALVFSVLLCTVSCNDYEAENFTVLDSEGKEVELYDYLGQPIVLNFWASWCYYCKIEMPYFDEAARENPDVLFMMVNNTDGVYETLEAARDYILMEGYSFPVFYDTALNAADAYGIDSFPTTYFIDSDGNIAAKHEGAMNGVRLAEYLAMIK